MNRFYSSLIINSAKFPKTHQVFRPRFNKEFFKRLTANIGQLELYINKRVKNLDESNYDIKFLKDDSRKLVNLKENLEKVAILDGENVNPEFLKIKTQLEDLEDRIMPLIVKVPNRSSKHVQQNEEIVLEEIKSDFLTKQKLSKVLSHRKLSFINNCYSKSIVGPNSHYYFGIGAKLQYALSDYFTNELELNNFIQTSGLCLTKSAVIESNNSQEFKTFSNDPCRILTDEKKFVTTHLVESSRECLTSFLTTLGPRSSNEPLRLMSTGAGYKNGSDWFDSDQNSVSQFQTLHSISFSPSIENYSMKEYHSIRDIVWNSYKKLELPVRLIQCSLDTMYSNEYDASRIDIWLPSRQQWLQVARITHYLDFITIRMGMKRGHIIDSSVYDGQALVAAIIENKQTNNGKFIIPKVLKNNLEIYLSNEEMNEYLNNKNNIESKTVNNNLKIDHEINYSILKNQKIINSNNNHQQRRYYRKNNRSIFGHSKRASTSTFINYFAVSFILFICLLMDWSDIWREYFPTWLQRFLWDQIYRKLQLLVYYLSLPKDAEWPKVIKYDEMDREYFKKTRSQIHETTMRDYDMNFDIRRRNLEQVKAALEKQKKDS